MKSASSCAIKLRNDRSNTQKESQLLQALYVRILEGDRFIRLFMEHRCGSLSLFLRTDVNI